jgi:cobalt-zinc-cadmium efflux system membrane fusion protein
MNHIEPSAPSRTSALIAWLGRILPTVLVLAGLGGVAWWGHRTGWSLPSFTSLTGNGAKGADDWCEEHGVPESACVECNPDLLPRARDHGWCKEHGVHNCPLEYPDVAQLTSAPLVTPAALERARRALDFAPRPENSSKCKLYNRRIQLASREAVEKAGIDVERVEEARVVEAVAANGEITYDQTRLARLSARVPGTVWWVAKQVGDEVRRGEVVALVDAAEVGKAKAEFLQAAALLDLRRDQAGYAKRAFDRGALPAADLQAAETALRESEIRLQAAEQALVNLGLPARGENVKGLAADEARRRVQFLGLPESVTQRLDVRTTTANLLPVVSPLDGVVVAREAMAGEVVDATKVLFVVTDVRTMWLTLQPRQEDARKIAPGQAVRFRTDGSQEEVGGTVSWVSTAVDEKTRTVKVRANLANADGRLRANTFGQGRVILREEKNAMVVPNEAVHWEGDCFVVFVRDRNFLADGAPKVFHVRTIRPGAKDSRNTEVIAGVLPGEVVATRGGGTLLGELLKGNMGEG